MPRLTPLLILLLAFFLRVASLDSLPPGWRDDEVIETTVHAQIVLDSGHPLYFIQAEGHEPLYHYQLGTLLTVARDDFLKSGEWTRAPLDRAMHHAFQRAAELAPDRFEFAYRYAESFYDLETPDWDGALKAWADLEEKAPTAVERQTMRLHAANILLKIGKRDHARALLETVDEPALKAQKQKLVAQLAETPEK